MPQFIAVTDGAGDKMLVNLDNVTLIYIDRKVSGRERVRICFGDEDWTEPKETLEQITALIGEPCPSCRKLKEDMAALYGQR